MTAKARTASRGMAPATAELYDRVIRLFATRSVSFADRQAIRGAVAPHLTEGITFDALPAQVQALITTNEAKPQIDGWASPKDVPLRDIPPASQAVDGPYITIEDAAPPRSRVARREGSSAAQRSRELALLGVETRADEPGNDLKRYWTKDPEGLAKWASKPHPWTALYRELRQHVGNERAKRIAAQWFKEVFGIWPGERKGENPVGPG